MTSLWPALRLIIPFAATIGLVLATFVSVVGGALWIGLRRPQRWADVTASPRRILVSGALGVTLFVAMIAGVAYLPIALTTPPSESTRIPPQVARVIGGALAAFVGACVAIGGGVFLWLRSRTRRDGTR